jgi:cytochrome c1
MMAVIPIGKRERYRAGRRQKVMNGWNARRLGVAVAVLFAAVFVSRCAAAGSAPPTPDVVAELQKLKIPTMPKTFTPEQRKEIEQAWSGRGQFFVKHGCFSCHAVSVYGVKGLAPIGPDLSNAEEDVEARFGRKLEDFLKEPQGTMQMVLSQLIVLTPEQKLEALEQLRAANKEYEKQERSHGSKER